MLTVSLVFSPPTSIRVGPEVGAVISCVSDGGSSVVAGDFVVVGGEVGGFVLGNFVGGSFFVGTCVGADNSSFVG